MRNNNKSNGLRSVRIGTKFAYFFLFTFLYMGLYCMGLTRRFVHRVSMDTPFADVNSDVGPGIITKDTNAKNKETGQNETESEKIKILEIPVDFISGKGQANSDPYSGNESSSEIYPDQNRKSVGAAKRKTPQFIFGHSTGHAGSTFVHAQLNTQGCPWYSVGKFQDASLQQRRSEITIDYPKCDNTVNNIPPRISKYIESSEHDRNATYIDIGHYHNRGRNIECLADYFQEDAAFVHIRRNRYDIAHSFTSNQQTPCMNTKDLKHSEVSVCPRSNEPAGPVNLPVNDEIWDALTPFQRFLWYADEMEHRWHALIAAHKDGRHDSGDYHASPMFLELTWSSSEQLSKGMNELRRTLGCTIVKHKAGVRNKHVEHTDKKRICALEIKQDYEYRRLMNYDNTTLNILVSSRFPQHVDSEECMESPEEIKRLTQVHAAEQGMWYDEDTWVFPSEEGGGESVD